MKRLLVGLAIIAAGLMVAVPPAQAVSFDLTSCHVTGGCGTQTVFGTVTLTQVGANVNFDVELSGGNRFVETGSADFQLFKFNGTGIVAGDITNEATVPAGVVPGGVDGFAGAFNGDGTGNFGFGVACIIPADCNGGSTPVFSELTFTVNGATIAELTVPNNLGNVFVVDILIASNGFTGPVDVTGGGGNGGGGGQTQVPGPISLVLMGVGLAVFAAARRGYRHLG